MPDLIPWNKKDGYEKPSQRLFRLNGIECPICQNELYDDGLVLLDTKPPLLPVYCLNQDCGFNGTRIPARY